MKDRLRRIILFTVIVITGSVMILIDVPLILMIPLILIVGFVILLLLGAITVNDIRSALAVLRIQNLKKTGFLNRLDQMKFFEKKPARQKNQPVSPAKKEDPSPVNPKNAGLFSPLSSFISSVGSLGTILKERSRRERKVEHINELLDKAVSEKVKGSALASAGTVVKPGTTPLPGTGGSALQKQPGDQDPFLSLSGDEFDVSLLDGLDDQESTLSGSPAPEKAPALPSGGSDLPMNEPDIPLPSLNINSEAEGILKNNGDGLEEFKGLEGGEAIDQDFGDLENLNLDEVDLDIDIEEENPSDSGSPAPGSESPESSPSPKPAEAVRTDWIASDAPKNADKPDNQISTQSEMAAFAGGVAGSDEDLLSSLTSDVKKVTKEKNISLLRDLKDFKAPATVIENELKEMFETMKTTPITARKRIPPAKELK